jgi:hypothetical protein
MMLLVPTLASAESVSLVRSAVMGSADPIVSTKVDNKPLQVGLDENGDVTIYYRKVSLTMSYNPADLLPPAKEQVVLNTSPQSSAVGGFGIKVGFAF